MKKVTIKYNPYLVATEITVDGEAPKQNSALNVGKKRLQEWVDKLPRILSDEYKDYNLSIEFIGTVTDFEDVKCSFESNKDKFSVEFDFHKTSDISDVEKTIDKIFEDIQNGPIPELRDEKIVSAFEKAKNSLFDVNVVATMSSGKSTLINALLGKKMMPAANEATTATIVKIIDTDQKEFSAVAFDKSGQVVEKIHNVSLEDMKRLNSDIKVSTIELQGKIPFVSSVGMRLVLIDTPGPNNSRDMMHKEMTYRMIADSDKSLVLYVMNAQQLGINDEKEFLDYVCQIMSEGGKQSRERFIFAVNRMDSFKPKDEGLDCIERALKNVKSNLEDRGIYNPNIFPVSSLAALELRTEDDEPTALDTFRRVSKKYEALHFDNYYQFSNLPQSVRNDMKGMVEQARKENDEDVLIDIYSGIVSIEKSISQYINKYARTTKVYDLVMAFNDKLNELAAVAHLQEAIRKDKCAKTELEEQISRIKAVVASAQNAKSRSEEIDQIDIIGPVKKRIESCFERVNTRISKLQSGEVMVENSVANEQMKLIQSEREAIVIQVKLDLERIVIETYINTIDKIIEEYKTHLQALNIGISTQDLSFNPLSLVQTSLTDLKTIAANHTMTKDESYEVDRFVKGNMGHSVGASACEWLNIGILWGAKFGLPGLLIGAGIGAGIGAAVGAVTGTRDHIEKEQVQIINNYVNMKEVSKDCFIESQEKILGLKQQVVDYIEQETSRLKERLKEDLEKIDQLLYDKLDSLSQTEAVDKAKEAEIVQKQKNLEWLEEIQTKVNNIIYF